MDGKVSQILFKNRFNKSTHGDNMASSCSPVDAEVRLCTVKLQKSCCYRARTLFMLWFFQLTNLWENPPQCGDILKQLTVSQMMHPRLRNTHSWQRIDRHIHKATPQCLANVHGRYIAWKASELMFYVKLSIYWKHRILKHSVRRSMYSSMIQSIHLTVRFTFKSSHHCRTYSVYQYLCNSKWQDVGSCFYRHVQPHQ